MARVDGMEGRLCRCGKGKGKEVKKEVSLLGSPLVLDCSLEEDVNSDDSYHTLPVVSLSQPLSSSPYQDSDKENVSSFDIEFDTKIALVPIGDAPPENAVAIPVHEPTLNISGLERLVAVRGQVFHGMPRSRHGNPSPVSSTLISNNMRLWILCRAETPVLISLVKPLR